MGSATRYPDEFAIELTQSRNHAAGMSNADFVHYHIELLYLTPVPAHS